MQIEHSFTKTPDQTKPYCLVNPDGSVAACFATHQEAVDAMSKTSKANNRYNYSEDPQYVLSPVGALSFAEGTDVTWIEALQARTYTTPQYGEVVVTTDKLNNFVSNFKENVRGIELTIDYEHGRDVAKGGKASGTIKDMKVEGDKLMYGVEFTDTAKKEIGNKEWKYFSADWADSYTHEDGVKHSDVILGGGLTNRPVAKGLSTLPINFSELYDEIQPDKVEPITQGGEMNEYLKRLAKSLNIEFAETDTDESALSEKCFTELTKRNAEYTKMEELRATVEGNKTFKEQFPSEFARMQKLEEDNRNSTSRTFAEGVGNMRFTDTITQKVDGEEDKTVAIETSKGLSAKCLDSVKELHMKFSEGSATATDFETVMTNIFANGIVDYGELGTANKGTQFTEIEDKDTKPTGSSQEIRMQFAEKVNSEMESASKEDKTIDIREATARAGKKHPELFNAYMGAN